MKRRKKKKKSGKMKKNKQVSVETDLALISARDQEKAEENDRFRSFISAQHPDIDSLVWEISTEVESEVDCTHCGNCCRSLMVTVEPEEVSVIAAREGCSEAAIKEKYFEESAGGTIIISRIPCHFLTGNSCTIYEDRFQTCRDFPYLHKEGFSRRLPFLLMHYGSCPIIYNVIERLKTATQFTLTSVP
ncbi:YkgJ family cysteine cluster protein [Flavihumibacter solisilvae]|nr:YkgJ family cysteine cluster protein [Flavihumibacter solisilvae]